MRILFLCQLVPYPPDSGPKIRAYYVLRYLARKHRVTLLAFRRSDDDPTAIQHLSSICEAVHTVTLQRSRWRDLVALITSIFLHTPLVIQRDAYPEMHKKINELVRIDKFDYIHSDQLWMAQYAMLPEITHPNQMKKTLDEHNACFQIFQRLAGGESNLLKKWILEREWRILQDYEAQVSAKFDQIVTVTDQDRTVLESLHKQGEEPNRILNFATIPISIDLDAPPVVDISENSSPSGENILHLGTMFWLPNIEGVLWFSREVLPKILEQVPNATLTIVGKNPPSEIVALANQDFWRLYTKSNSPDAEIPPSPVNVTGYLADPLAVIKAASVFIVPLFSGSGMRVKILDAWRWGLPVVSTTIGAEGIHYRDGDNILIADDKENFAAAVCRILTDTTLNRKLRLKGRKWVERYYDWEKTYIAWDEIYPPG